MPRTTPHETLALHLMHRLYEATEGRPNRWRMLAGIQLTQATLELAVERGWLIVDKGEHCVALTEAGRARVRRWRGNGSAVGFLWITQGRYGPTSAIQEDDVVQAPHSRAA
jgi:hypothetical protein